MTDERPRVPQPHGFVVGVLGASGGLGASTIATVLSVRASMAGHPALLVDAHPWGGGLDVLLGLDSAPGLRWPDFGASRGEIDVTGVLARLPSARGCRVLSWDRSPSRASAHTGVGLVASLTHGTALTVIDVPGPESSDAALWWGTCDHVVLLCGSGVRQVATAAVVLEALESAAAGSSEGDLGAGSPSIRGVLREQAAGSPDRDTVSAILGLPLLGSIKHDARVESAVAAGEAVGVRTSPMTHLCDEILADILPSRRRAA